MLKKIDYTGKEGSGSIFVCDMCGKELRTSSDKRYRVGVDTSAKKNNNTKYMSRVKRYDLCTKCCSIVCANIERWKDKHAR